MAKLLVIDDDRAARRTLELAFQAQGHEVFAGSTIAEGKELWIRHESEVILLEIGRASCR